MALFKIHKGNSADLETNKPQRQEGFVYLTEDDMKFYIDTASGTHTTAATLTAAEKKMRRPLNASKADLLQAWETSPSDTAGRWTVTIPGITEDNLIDGLTIRIRINTSYNSSYNTLNVNNLGAKLVYYRYKSRLTGHVPQFAEMLLTYRTPHTANGVNYEGAHDTDQIYGNVNYGKSGWVLDSSYSDGNTYDRTVNTYERARAGEAIASGQLCMFDKDWLLRPISQGTSATTKTANTAAFQLPRIVFVNESRTAGQITDASYIYENIPTNKGTSTFNSNVPTYSNIYLVGTLDDNGYFLLDTTNATSYYIYVTAPSSGSLSTAIFTKGKYYLYVGSSYSSANYFQLAAYNQLYYCDDDDGLKLTPVAPLAAKVTSVDNVSYTAALTTGSESGTLTIDGTDYVIYHVKPNQFFWQTASNGSTLKLQLALSDNTTITSPALPTITPQWGGTGATSLDSGKVIIGNGTSAVTFRSIYSKTTAGSLDYTDATKTYLVDKSALKFWDGRYDTTADNASSLAYSAQGKFGTIITANKSAWTKNRVLLASSTTNVASAPNLYTDGSALGINKTSVTSGYSLDVEGAARVNGKILSTNNINIILGDTDKFVNWYYSTNETAGGSWRIGVYGSGTSDTNYFVIESGTSNTSATTWNRVLQVGQNTYNGVWAGNFDPVADDSKSLGNNDHRWKNIYGVNLYGDGANVTNINAYNIATGVLTIARGGTGASTAAGAVTNLMGSTAIGSGTQPVYYNGTKFAACTAYSKLLTAVSRSDNTLTVTVGGTTKTTTLISDITHSWTQSTGGGPILNLAINDQTAAITLPTAGNNSGVVTADTQTIKGSKTFVDDTTIGRNIIRNSSTVQDGQGDVILALGYKTGYPLYNDPTFKSGVCSVGSYSSVPVTRDTYTNFSQVNPGTGSDYILKISCDGSASINNGGFVQTISSAANKVFIQIFRALIPAGYSVVGNSNNTGNSRSDQWLTSTAGTGKWEWYARRILCGKDGTFSTSGHVSLQGTPAGTASAPIVWYLSYCNAYDVTQADYDGLRVKYADDLTGTLSVEHGGTGATSFTKNCVIMSGSSTTAALTTRAVVNNTSNTVIAASTSFPTMNTLYYGLTVINNASQTRGSSIYAPTSAGTAGQILTAAGGTSAPTWTNTSSITVGAASQLSPAGTTAQFWRGDNTWSNILKPASSTALGIDSNLKIGTAIKDLHISIGSGSGTDINSGNSGGITFGTDSASYGGIYWQTSGSYGSRLHFATTSSFANGAYTRMLIDPAGNVGIGTLSPAYKLHVVGDMVLGNSGNKNIYYKGTKATKAMITFLDNTSDTNGNGIKIGGGGVVVIGAGESAGNLSPTASSENLYLMADSTVYLYANADTIANRVGFAVTTSGNIVPRKADAANDNKQDLGASDNRWKTIYGTTYEGSIIKIHQGTAVNPSLTSNGRIEFDYSDGQSVVISYTPNDSYRAPAGLKIMGGTSATPAWLEVEGSIYANGGCRVPHTGNTTGTLGNTTTPIYADGGQLKAGTALGASAYHPDSYFALASHGTHVTYGTSATAVATTSAAGTATTVSRSDHKHSISLATGDSNGQVKIAGTNVSVKGLGSNAYTSTAYLPLAGGTMTGAIVPNASGTISFGSATAKWADIYATTVYGKINSTEILDSGDLTVNGVAYLNNETYAESLTANSLLVNGNSNFVQIPTAPTAADGTNDTQLATTAFVMNQLRYADAMVFKGVVNANGDLPATHDRGWTYKVGTAGTYAGIKCEVGDIIICMTDGTAANNAHWTVVQNNIDGAVTGPASATDNAIARFNGTTGKIIQNSGITISDDNCIIMPHTAGKVNSVQFTYSSTIDFFMGIGSGNVNHGIYDTKLNDWVLSAGADNAWSLNGNAATATKLKTARSIWGQSFDGTKDISGNFTMKNTSSRYHYFYVNQNNTDNTVAYMLYDSGNLTNVTAGRWCFAEYSPNTTADTTTTGFKESYRLPAVAIGLTENKDYNILTTKTAVTVAQGGTGQTSFAADSIIMSGSSTTAAFTTRGVTNTTTAGALGGKTTWAADTTIPTINTLAYWDGRYQSTSNKSNLTYCVKGAFGDLAIINKPTSNTTTTFLRGDGTWQSVTWSNVSGKPSTFTPSSHTHGNLSNDGKITTAITVAANDYLIIGDNSASGTIGKGPVFDGSTATKALTQKGTWETFNNYSHPTGDGNKHVPANGTSNNGKYLRASATAGTYTWAQVNWSELAGKPSSFTPSSHTHGNITNAGAIGTTANYSVYTTTSGVLTAGSLAVSDPTASGNAISFIDTISQSSIGKITVTKKTVRDASDSQSGVVSTSAQTFAGNKTFKGDIYPQATNTYSLGKGGSSGQLRWKALFIGTNDTYGASDHPIYWNNGIPTTATVGDNFISYSTANLSGSFSILDSLYNYKLRGNRFAGFDPAGTTIQHSTDGGATWVEDTSISDAMKKALFTTSTSLYLTHTANTSAGETQTLTTADTKLRIIMDTGAGHVYTALRKIMIYISTGGSQNCKVTIDAALQNNPTNYTHVICTDQPISGWSGWNVIQCNFTTYGNTGSSQYGRIRFTFSTTGNSSSYANKRGLSISSIYGYGGVGWTTPSTLALTDHVYTFDQDFNVSFPKKVTAQSFSGILTPGADVTIANNDKLLIADNSDSNAIKKISIAFDGATATKALTQKGTWETFNNYSHPTGDGNKHIPANGTSNDGKYLRASATAGTYTWAQVNWSELAGKPSSFTPSSHTHGNLSNDGKITTAITVAANDYLIIGDNSASGVIGKGPAFDGSTATKALTQKGTWETFNNYSHPTGDGNKHVPANGTSNNGKYLRASATAGTYTWAQVDWSELTGKPDQATSWPNWGQILQSGANNIDEGTSDFTDNTELFSSYASNDGFADSHSPGRVYRRDAIHMYNYIKGKLDSVYKAKQTAVTAPTAATNKWVSSIGQNAQGVITASYSTLDTSGAWSGNAGTATKLKTAVNLWGNSFDGSASISGSIIFGNEKQTVFKITRKQDSGGGWSYDPIVIKDNADTVFARIGVYGAANAMTYMYIGTGSYNATTHIRINSNGEVMLPGITAMPTVAADDCLLMLDNSATKKIVKGPTFVTSTAKKYLKDTGAWAQVDWSELTGKPSSFTPSSHTHGNITNAGAIGTTANYSVYTTTSGVLTAGSLAVSDPTANGNAISFIDTISQSSIGKITVTKKTIPTASSSNLGLIKIGYSTSGNNYAVQLSDSKAYVNVPWTDANVKQSASSSGKWRKVLLHYSQDNASTTAVTTSTNQVYAAVDISVQPSTGTIRASKYNVNDKVTLTWNDTTQSLDFIFN